MSNSQLGAQKKDNLGAAIAQRTNVDGSVHIIAPFVKSLSSSINGLNLRDEARKEKPMVVADSAWQASGHYRTCYEQNRRRLFERMACKSG